jgi:Heterokaryon incompatibility protein (HET)
LQERSEQVVKMGAIFKQAAKVITWLGDADNESELAFSLPQNLKDCLYDRNSCRRILNDETNLESLYGPTIYSIETIGGGYG